MSSTTTPVQNALTALIPIKAEYVDQLRQQLIDNPIDPSGLDAVGTVHFARIFVFQPNNASGVPSNLAAVITSYDNNFAAYIQAFVNQPAVAAFFNMSNRIASATDMRPNRLYHAQARTSAEEPL